MITFKKSAKLVATAYVYKDNEIIGKVRKDGGVIRGERIVWIAYTINNRYVGQANTRKEAAEFLEAMQK